MTLTTRTLSLVLLIVFLVHEVGAQDVRVRLLDLAAPRQIAVAASGGDVQLFAGEFEDPLTTLSAGEEIIVSRASNQLHVRIGEMGLFATALRAEPLEGAQLGLAVREGRSLNDSRRYPGTLHVTPDAGDWELKLVNAVDLEEYVACVVSSEYGLDDLEGSKAMAVVARTYTLAMLKEGSELADHTLTQVYQGSDGVNEVARRAAEETRGEVVTYDDALIQAVYFSSSGGHTADNESVWDGAPLPYLRGKSDPYGTSSPHAQWTANVSRAKLLGALGEAFQVRVEAFVIGMRSRDGRVATVELILESGGRMEVSANEFRLRVIEQFGARSLRSAFFDARREGDTYVFDGRGYGHGVGLSQWGAHDMARQGRSYREILDFYYSGVQITSLDGSTTVAPPVREVAIRPDPETPPAHTTRIGW